MGCGPACWYFGLERERPAPQAWRCVRERHATVAALFNILGAEVMAQYGYLEEVCDGGARPRLRWSPGRW